MTFYLLSDIILNDMERFGSTSHRGFSVRSIFTFVLVVVVTALLWAIFGGSTPANAADQANWNGASLLHEGNQFYAAGKAEAGASHGLPVGAEYYLYVTPSQPGAPTSASKKALVIYFAPGTSPPTETSATRVEFDYNPATKVFSNPTNTTTIVVNPSGDAYATSCAIEGVGWIVCSVSVFLAQGMDWVFTVIASFMEVQPLTVGNTNGDLYVAWNVMRGIANIAFIIAFMIIIYSQLTNVALSNYGLKRLLPRLIIAAILVNLSYVISAIAIDLSNIIGYSLQDIFIQLRNQIFNVDNDTWGASMISWESITGFVLSGGTATLALGIGAVTAIAGTGGTVLGAIFLLLPVLLGLLLAILVVLLILAARQAIITILVVIAPLAFVAYLLPNTEKYFDKWRSLFMTMLIFFPAFAVVFGGSQLAGALIIQNADSINILILGMIVQVAPLVITPFLLKFSGKLLGTIAGLVNNPNKGILDRTRKWSSAQADYHRLRGISGAKMNGAPGELRKRNFMRRASAGLNNMNRRTEDRTGLVKSAYDNSYHNTPGYEKIHTNQAAYDLDKDRIHNEHGAHTEHLKTQRGSVLYDRAIRTEASKQVLESSQNATNTHFNAQRMMASSALNLSSTDLEVSKLNLESSNNQFTAMIERQKANIPHSALGVAARHAQTTKDHLESAQLRIQEVFDLERATAGRTLNLSNRDLEVQKIRAEGAKAQFTEYITTLKSEKGSVIHEEAISTERYKQAQQVSEAQLSRIITEYKAGGETDENGTILVNGTPLMPQERVILEQMKADAARLAAEQQGGTVAQYEVQRHIAETMTSVGPLSESLLDVAQGIGGSSARVRAQAQALKVVDKLDDEALGATVDLLKMEAQRGGTTIKKYSRDLIEAFSRNEAEFAGQEITPERLKAALQAQADEKNMSLFESIKGNRLFDQTMVNEVVARNNGVFKIAGGFHLQDNPSLNIDNYATDEEYENALRISRVQSLGNASAANISGLKFGWVDDFAKDENLEANIQAAFDAGADEDLRKAYNNVHEALTTPTIRATLGDRETEIRKIEAALAARFGRDPVVDDRPQIQRP